MGKLVNFVTPLHKRASRNYIDRMINDKVKCMLKAKEYEYDYWDGDRKFGYGGYKYDGRWKLVAEQFIQHYELKDGVSILDIGCGKAFLLHELKALLPKSNVTGFDISCHGLNDAPTEVRNFLFKYNACDVLPFGNKSFDLVLSLGCFHNLRIFQLKTALYEMNRVAKNSYLMLESYRNEQEQFNLQCWALTCESFFDTAEWIWIYNNFGYYGDYEFIYFE